MSLLRSLSDGLRSLFRKEQINKELDEELNGFLEMAAEEKMKQGLSRKDALRAVRLERGSLEVTKEIVRSATWESRGSSSTSFQGSMPGIGASITTNRSTLSGYIAAYAYATAFPMSCATMEVLSYPSPVTMARMSLACVFLS